MVYIQSKSDRSIPHHFDAACAMYGAEDNGVPFRLTSMEEVQSGKFDNLIKTHMFVGSTEFMTEVFCRVHRLPNPILNTNRDHLLMTVRDIRNNVASGQRCFVKPFFPKQYNLSGMIMDEYTISALSQLDENVELKVYDVIENIQSEWRLYVHHNRIVDARNYSGDFKISPNYTYAESIISQYNGILPSAYTLDLGMTNNVFDHTFVVEFNDMWAIGNYGIENSLYYRMLRERYFDIINQR